MKKICSKPQLAERPLLSTRQAEELATIFKTLGSPTRLRLLHALVRAGELSVSELADTVNMKTQAVSNQLQRLTEENIVESRRSGLKIYYRTTDPCVKSLLDRGWCLSEDTGKMTVDSTRNVVAS